jgi:NAD-dependent SIR2 family protein deacetylase
MSDISHLDGSAAAGLLSELFAVEITLATAECVRCHADVAVAEMHLYALEMGAVLRCPGCEAVMLRIGCVGDERWIDATGMRRMRISRATVATGPV